MSRVFVGTAKAKKDGASTEDYPVDHKDDFDIPINDPFENPMPDIIMSPEMEKKVQLDNLAFAQEPVEILILPSNQEFGETEVPCWNQGKGAEIFDRATGRWYEAHFIPRGKPVITRRKYAEIIMKSKTQDVRTVVVETPGQDTVNRLSYRTTANYPTQIVTDKSPRAKEWLEYIARFRG